MYKHRDRLRRLPLHQIVARTRGVLAGIGGATPGLMSTRLATATYPYG